MKPNQHARTAPVAEILVSLVVLLGLGHASAQAQTPVEFLETHCFACHSPALKKGDLDLTAVSLDRLEPASFAVWEKVYDRVRRDEMPPLKQARPEPGERSAVLAEIRGQLMRFEGARFEGEPRTGLRRLTRSEYENTLRDLFEKPGILVKDDLPPDGLAHGFDKSAEALEISHVHLANYLEAADRVLELAIARQPAPPARKVYKVSLANEQSTLGACILEGDGVMLRDQKPDPKYPPAGTHRHIDYGSHLALGMHADVSPGTSVGLFRHEDDSFRPSFAEFITIYPGMYRIRTHLWSFLWDKGNILPSPRAQTARLDVWHITGDGRGTGHPSTVLGYFDAPSIAGRTYEQTRWLNAADSFGFNFTDSQIGHQIRGSKERLMGWTGPGVACDGLEVEGPIHDRWPPTSHRRLFGDLPLVEFVAEQNPGVRPPVHKEPTQKFNARNQPDPAPHTLKLWTVGTTQWRADADKLLADFLPLAFRRPVSADDRRVYVDLVMERKEAGDSFEAAMRRTYRDALCSPEFLYHVEPPAADSSDQVDEFAMAARLSYFLWNSMPDERLMELARSGELRRRAVVHEEVERLLQDGRSERFRNDFLDQWLKLNKIAANDPDPKLYGGWRVDLQDAMVAETRGFFREMIERDLSPEYLVQSDFVMLNERLAGYYKIPGVVGCEMRLVAVPQGSPRGPFLTQASILKVTANGTTTSPVPRGAFVMDRLLGRPPDPPPPNIPAVEPDVRGATTIREQLANHRDNPACAACHAKLDPPGFALESFDVIGGWREKYQSITDRKPAVDPSGVLADGRPFRDILEFQALVVADPEPLWQNLAERLATYALGRGLSFGDRQEAVAGVVAAARKQNGGLRTLIHELVESDFFWSR